MNDHTESILLQTFTGKRSQPCRIVDRTNDPANWRGTPQAVYLQRNNEARTCKHCCTGKV